jgi:hypothetical protein
MFASVSSFVADGSILSKIILHFSKEVNGSILRYNWNSLVGLLPLSDGVENF